MLYLSRLLLNARNSRVRRDLAQCQELHRTLLRAFPALETKQPGEGARDRFGVLYRIETARNAVIPLLVQSAAEPDWSYLPEMFPTYLLPDQVDMPNPAVKHIGEQYERLRDAQEFVFRLRANPTRRVSANNPKEPSRWHGKRVTYHTEEGQLGWLRRKADLGGFALLQVQTNHVADVRTQTENTVTGRHARSDGSTALSQQDHITLGSVLFEGRLRITDVERFRQTLIKGIGSGKAYGFGLLSIATVSGGGA